MVRISEEYERIRKLPKRIWEETPDEHVMAVTRHFLTDEGHEALDAKLRGESSFGGTDIKEIPVPLWKIQVACIDTMADYGTLIADVPVGYGKTIVTALAAEALGIEASDVLLLVKGGLLKKTFRDFAALSRWYDFEAPRVLSYEKLSQSYGDSLFDQNVPRVILCDESQALKSSKAARTKKVLRTLKRFKIPIIPLSGTMAPRGPADAAHYLAHTDPKLSPLPVGYRDITDWHNALGSKLRPGDRMHPGALLSLSPEVAKKGAAKLRGSKALAEARTQFAHRWNTSPLVVSAGVPDMPHGLRVDSWSPTALFDAKRMEQLFHRLRVNPAEDLNGNLLENSLAIYRHARELVCGLQMIWKVQPPKEWLEARSQWYRFVKDVMASKRHLDSYGNVLIALEEETLAPSVVEVGKQLKDTWDEHWASFQPESHPVWAHTHMLDACEQWLGKNKSARSGSIIWVEFPAFGRKLSKRLGIPYFGAQGLDAKGNYIEDAKGPIIASLAANGTGRNLQFKWWRNLAVTFPGMGGELEQNIGRTDRHGQKHDEVTWTFVVVCTEQHDNLLQVLSDNQWIEQGRGKPIRFSRATVDVRKPKVLL